MGNPETFVERKHKRPKPEKTNTQLLECLLCLERYSRDDILNGLYQMETMVCSYCYAKMQASPHSQSCFGKPTFVTLDGKRLLGYNPLNPLCADKCVDRNICARIVHPANGIVKILVSPENSSEDE